MTHPQPTITVGLPVAQENATYVRQAVQSVLNQRFTDWELVIVADGSSPDMVALLRSYSDPRIRVVAHNVSAGLASRLNEIASIARGEYLARFDADDIMMPDRLARQREFLLDSGADVISGRAIVIDESAKIVAATPDVSPHVSVETMLATTPLIHPTVFARTEWFRSHPYDESLLRCQDKALWIVASADSKIVRDDQRVLFYRIPSDLDPAKYARSARFERKIVRRYGPSIIGRGRTASILATGWAKQQIIRVASALGRGDVIMRRRFASVAHTELGTWGEVLAKSVNPLPPAHITQETP